eukprot:tig00020816_g14186.t1
MIDRGLAVFHVDGSSTLQPATGRLLIGSPNIGSVIDRISCSFDRENRVKAELIYINHNVNGTARIVQNAASCPLPDSLLPGFVWVSVEDSVRGLLHLRRFSVADGARIVESLPRSGPLRRSTLVVGVGRDLLPGSVLALRIMRAALEKDADPVRVHTFSSALAIWETSAAPASFPSLPGVSRYELTPNWLDWKPTAATITRNDAIDRPAPALTDLDPVCKLQNIEASCEAAKLAVVSGARAIANLVPSEVFVGYSEDFVVVASGISTDLPAFRSPSCLIDGQPSTVVEQLPSSDRNAATNATWALNQTVAPALRPLAQLFRCSAFSLGNAAVPRLMDVSLAGVPNSVTLSVNAPPGLHAIVPPVGVPFSATFVFGDNLLAGGRITLHGARQLGTPEIIPISSGFGIIELSPRVEDLFDGLHLSALGRMSFYETAWEATGLRIAGQAVPQPSVARLPGNVTLGNASYPIDLNETELVLQKEGGARLVAASSRPTAPGSRIVCIFKPGGGSERGGVVVIGVSSASTRFATLDCVSPFLPPAAGAIAVHDASQLGTAGVLFNFTVQGPKKTATERALENPPSTVFAPQFLGARFFPAPRLAGLPVLVSVADWTVPTAACWVGAGASSSTAGFGRVVSTAAVLCVLDTFATDAESISAGEPSSDVSVFVSESAKSRALETGVRIALIANPSLEGDRAARRLPPAESVAVDASGGTAVAISSSTGDAELSVCVDVERRIFVSGRMGFCLMPAAAPGTPSSLFPSVFGYSDPSLAPLPISYFDEASFWAPRGAGSTQRDAGIQFTADLPSVLVVARNIFAARSVDCLFDDSRRSPSVLTRFATPTWSLVECQLLTSSHVGFVSIGFVADGVVYQGAAQLEFRGISESFSVVPPRVPKNGGVLLIVKGDSMLPTGGPVDCVFDGRRTGFSRWISTSAAACETPLLNDGDLLSLHTAATVRVAGAGPTATSTAAAGSARVRLLNPISAWSVNVNASAETGGTPVLVGGSGFDDGDSGIGCNFGRVFVRMSPLDGSTSECLSPALSAQSSIVRMTVPELDISALALWDGTPCNATAPLAYEGAPSIPLNASAAGCGPQYVSRTLTLLRAVDLGDATGPRVKARTIDMRIAIGGGELVAAHDVANAAWGRLLSAAAAFYANMTASLRAANTTTLLSPTARRTTSFFNHNNLADGLLAYLRSVRTISGASIHRRRELKNATDCPATNCVANATSELDIESVGYSNASRTTNSNSSAIYTWYEFPEPAFPLRYALDIDVQPVPYVVSLEPKSSFTTGYTPILVRGGNFVRTSELVCQFGTTLVPGVYRNSSAVVCHAPPQQEHGPVPLSVSNNGRQFASGLLGAVFFTYEACPAGSFCRSGAILPCPRGHFCPTRVEGNRTWSDLQDAGANVDPFPETVFALLQCPPGTYQDEVGQPFCKPCRVGGVCPRLGMVWPDICPAGELCDQESLVFGKICPPGFICNQGTKTGIAFNSSAPALGPLNSALGIVELPPDACEQTRREVQSGTPPSQWPYAGPEPLQCNALNVSIDTYDLVKAPPFGYPKLCPPGFYCEAGTGLAETILGDFFSPQPCFGGASCPAGQDNPQGRGLCEAGFYCVATDAEDGALAQVLCDRGHFCPSQGLTKPTPCGEGSYQDQLGSTACKSCPLQYYCPTTKLVEPLLTEPGYYSPGVGTVDQRPCTAGSYSDKFGTAACSSCLAGTYATGYNNTNCTAAPPGKFVNFDGAALPADCNPGTYTAKVGSRQCDLCLPGFFTAKFGQRECQPAEPGFVVPSSGSTAQQECPAGSYMPFANASACIPCESGSYCPTRGLTAPVKADPGFFVASPSSIAQLPCRKGSFQPESGQPECQACPSGSICPRDQMTSPIPAPKGTFSSGEGNTFAAKCAPGNYTSTEGYSICLRCPAGFQCLQEGTFEPQPCQAGTYRPLDDGVNNAISCIPCPEGTYSEVAGATDISACIPCPAGLVCAVTGTRDISRASKCADGYVCSTGTSGSSQFAEKCPAGFYCPAGTTPASKYALPCEAGYYCFEQARITISPLLNSSFKPTATSNSADYYVEFYWALARAPLELLSDESVQYMLGQIAASRSRSGSDALSANIATTINVALSRAGSARRHLSAAAIFGGAQSQPAALAIVAAPREFPTLPAPALWTSPLTRPRSGNESEPPSALSVDFEALQVPAGLKCPDGSTSIDQCFSTGDLQRIIDPSGAPLPSGVGEQWRRFVLTPSGGGASRPTDPATGAGGQARKGNATYYAPQTDGGYSLVSVFLNLPELAANAFRAAPGAPFLNYTKGDFGFKFVSRVPSSSPPPADGTVPLFKQAAGSSGKNGSASEPLPFMLARTDGKAVDSSSLLQINLLPMSDLTPAFFIDMDLYNPSNLVGFDTLATQPIASLLLKRAERAILGTNKAFVAIVTAKTQTMDFVSPTNLQSLAFEPNRNEPSTWFVPIPWNQTNAKYPFLLTVASTNLEAVSYDNVDPSGRNVEPPLNAEGKPYTFVVPYLPYISNCAGFGRYVPIFAIFEDSAGCNLTKQEETVPTQQYNPFGPPPKGDACDYELKCVYEEELASTEGQSATYWFEPTEGEVLFQIPWQPVLPKEVDEPDKFWSGLQSSGQFATVETKTDGDGTASLWAGTGSKLAARRVSFEASWRIY